MRRREWLERALALAMMPASGITGLAFARQSGSSSELGGELVKSKAEWRKLLSREAYAVLFDEDTERAFTSPHNNEKRPGTYVCTACFLPLFSSKTKYDSGTGWPSFYEPLQGRMGTKLDFTQILPRTEYHCLRCSGHQGHVFSDGPPPTGKRWCNNGLALRFVPDGERLPDLRT